MNSVRSIRWRALGLGFSYAGFAAFLAASSGLLPERVASHFNSAGDPDGWMSRGSHLNFMIVFGTVFPLTILVICYLLRYMPPSLIQIPHREYWLAPERHRETCDHLFSHALWFAWLGVLFMTGIHFLILRANTQEPPRLSVGWVLTVTALFIVGLLWWIVALLLHYRRQPETTANSP